MLKAWSSAWRFWQRLESQTGLSRLRTGAPQYLHFAGKWRIHQAFSLFSIGLILALYPQITPSPIVIPIENPSFEQGEAGWQFSAGSRVIQVQPCSQPIACVVTSGGVPVADIGYGSFIYQTVHVPAMPVGVYTLKFSVANWFYWYPGEFTASISLSKAYESPWCSMSAHPRGDFTQYTLLCTVRDMYAQDLTIRFQDKGDQSLFTSIQLTFTPEDQP